jgi:hypothetical protein
LINVLYDYFNIFLVFKSVSNVLEINQLVRSEEIRVTVSKFKDICLFSSVYIESNFFLKLHGYNINGLIGSL